MGVVGSVTGSEDGMPPVTSAPIYANYPSEKLTIGAGVAIFHIASERVVVCYHTRDKYWFLPKGRKNANEDVCRAAEREGFEESGYRNRLVPLPMSHRAPDPDEGHEKFVTEPIWTQLLPLTATSQYMLFWYAAETLPPEDEQSYVWNATNSMLYRIPNAFPKAMTLEQRLLLDSQVGNGDHGKLYEPVQHEGTGVDDEERLYRSQLLTIEDARKTLKGSVMEDVVKRGWEAIQLRLKMEKTADEPKP